jgi:ubiquinone/menaquinone biosynthesis C-methylase UbiE
MVRTLSDSRFVNQIATAAERIREVGELLVGRAGVEPGMEVLDVGTGTGNAALPAAKAGARVIGLDASTDLLAIARERAADAMIELDWVEGSPESLPFEDSSFDRVLTVFGHAFEAQPERVAAELERVCRPGGAIGLCAWATEGIADRVRELLGRPGAEIALEDRTLTLDGSERAYVLAVVKL